MNSFIVDGDEEGLKFWISQNQSVLNLVADADGNTGYDDVFASQYHFSN
jgi:hypothetical protein